MNADVYGVTHSTTYTDADGVIQTKTVNNYLGLDGEAWIDPVIAFNTPFLAANNLVAGAITLSSGVSNAAPAVPEPASWALMITGFGLCGIALRRRRAIGIA
jgi:PEP-CTERM motif